MGVLNKVFNVAFLSQVSQQVWLDSCWDRVLGLLLGLYWACCSSLMTVACNLLGLLGLLGSKFAKLMVGADWALNTESASSAWSMTRVTVIRLCMGTSSSKSSASAASILSSWWLGCLTWLMVTPCWVVLMIISFESWLWWRWSSESNPIESGIMDLNGWKLVD